MRLPPLLIVLVALTCTVFAETPSTPKLELTAPALQQGNARVVLVGDSITGQSRNHPAGYAYQLEWALQQAYPGCHPQIVSLGGSGQGVQAWLNTEQRSRTANFPLDVKGLDVKTELDQPADVLIVMLGMNDVLAPYVLDEPASIDQWAANYLELVHHLQSRLKPKLTAIATPTLCTEDPASPKNAMMDKLILRMEGMLSREALVLLPTHDAMAEVLAKGREGRWDFHVTHDYVHPNEAGHIAIAMGMLRGLQETAAAKLLEEKKLANLLQFSAAPGTRAPRTPVPWLVAAGLVRKPWNDQQPLSAATFQGPVEEAIEARGDFRAAKDPATGQPLTWRPYTATVDFTGGDDPDSVDFAAVTHAHNFETGYGVRWIHSGRERPVNVELSTQTFAGTPYLEVWLDGKSLYAGLLAKEPGKKKTVPAQLATGWHMLVFALNHAAWQMQCTVHLAGVDGDALEDVRYAITPPESGR